MTKQEKLSTFPLYIETAFGRMIVKGYHYPRNAARSRIWDVLRNEGWIASKITFDAQIKAWIASVDAVVANLQSASLPRPSQRKHMTAIYGR